MTPVGGFSTGVVPSSSRMRACWVCTRACRSEAASVEARVLMRTPAGRQHSLAPGHRRAGDRQACQHRCFRRRRASTGKAPYTATVYGAVCSAPCLLGVQAGAKRHGGGIVASATLTDHAAEATPHSGYENANKVPSQCL